MNRKFVVQTERGQRDSLKDSVKLVFALMPAESDHYTSLPNPVALWSIAFDSNGSARHELGFESKFAFQVKSNENQFTSFSMTAGNAVSMTSSRGGARIGWSNPKPCQETIGSRQPAVVAVNRTGSGQDVYLLVKQPNVSTLSPIAFYQGVGDDENVIAPTNLSLQAYIVDSPKECGSILHQADCARPLFLVPVPCNSLPDVATWTLCQDRGGEIQLKGTGQADSKSQARLGSQSVASLAESLDNVQNQLEMVVKSLKDTQNRLTVVERSLGDNQLEILAARQDINDTRAQLSSWARTIPAIEAKASRLETSLSSSETRISAAERLVERVQVELTSGQKSTNSIRSDLAKLEISAIARERKLSATQNSIATQSRQVSALDGRVLHIETKVADITNSLSHIPQQVVEPRVAIVEARVVEMNNSLTKTKMDASTTRESIQTLGGRIPLIETKADKFERSLGQVQGEVAAIQLSLVTVADQLTALEPRVTTVEKKGDRFEESLDPVQPDSPYLFSSNPTRSQGNPNPLPNSPPFA